MNANPRPGAWTAPSFSFRFDPPSLAELDAQVRDAMRKEGIEPPDNLQLDGEVHRFSTKQGRARDDGGVYQIHPDGIPAGWFQDHRSTDVIHFRADIGRRLTAEEEAAHRRRMEAIKQAREIEQARRHAEAVTKTRALLAAGDQDTTRNPYLTRKGVKIPPGGAVVLNVAKVAAILNYAPCAKGEPLAGEILVLPITRDGEIVGAELIDEAGRKCAVAGSVKAGACWMPEPIPPDAKIIGIAEGCADTLTVKAAVGWPVMAALSSSNLLEIAEQSRRDHPGAEIVVCADLDKATRQPDPHAVKAAEAVGGRLAVPELSSEEGKDWNDHHLVHGLESTRAALLSVLAQEPPEHPAITKAGALREAVRLALEIDDPVARALELQEIGKAHLGAKSPTAAPAFIEAAERGARRVYPLPPSDARSLAATAEEMAAAKLAPRCIVSQHSFADVALVSASGGSGKTTSQLWEAVHIITGRRLYGLEIEAPGPVLFITAEDPRNVILARLHRVMAAMEPPLSETEQAAMEAGFHVWDVSGDLSRLVDIDQAGRIMPTGFTDAIIDTARAIQPAVIVCDPIISFMPGESRLNDAEQAIIIEGRRIVRALDCCVRFITHVSQAAARAGTLDQYASRGGTALADGARMVTVLAAWHPGDKDEPPITLEVSGGASIIKLARPKLSYCPPQPLIWLARDGYRFTWALAAPPMTPEVQIAADADQVERFLVSELADGRRYSRATLEQARFRLGMNRDPLRRALAELEISRRVMEEPLPAEERIGGRKTYLRPASTSRAASAR